MDINVSVYKYNIMAKQVIGYTTGTFDMIHNGHINLLKRAKSLCDILIVGVSTDELAKYKGKIPIIPYEERAEIVQSIRYVDQVIPQTDRNKVNAYYKLKYDKLIVGDDWLGDPEWNEWENELKQFNVPVIYLPRTPNISTTQIIDKIKHI